MLKLTSLWLITVLEVVTTNVTAKKFKPFTLDTKHICYTMTIDKNIARGLTMAVTLSVNIVNSVLKILVRSLVDMIGYDTDSERVSTIMVVTFISAFFNTAIIPLLTNANLAFVPLFKYLPFRMNYSDFDESWYLTIGTQIVRTILIQAFMPYISLCVSLGMRLPLQWLDSGPSCCPKVRPEEMPSEEEIAEAKKIPH